MPVLSNMDVITYEDVGEPTKSSKHILTVDQFTKKELEQFCYKAALHQSMDSYYFSCTNVPSYYFSGTDVGWYHNGKRWIPNITRNKIMTALFYETSTRTYASFISAMIQLGGNCIPIQDARKYSSVSKGETLEDTIRTIESYSDVIVLRHDENGAADRAAAVATTASIINAGDGTNEHPTQALLDFFTILTERGWTLYNGMKIEDVIAGLTVTFMGDLKLGRTVHSLVKLLRAYEVKINWVSPLALKIPDEYLKEGDTETMRLSQVIKETDVLYVVRTQFERFANAGLPLDSVFSYDVTAKHMKAAKSNMVLMHPLPRNEEIPLSLDSDPRSAYFRQMKYGLYMRMAVLQTVLEK